MNEDPIDKAHRLAHEDRERAVAPRLNLAYRKGLYDGIVRYAWWKDGVQYVGCGIKTLEEALKEAMEKGPELPGEGLPKDA